MQEITGWVIEKPAGGSGYFYYDVTSKWFSLHPFVYDTLMYATSVCEKIKEGVVLPITYTVKRPVYQWVSVTTEVLGDYLCDAGRADMFILDTLTRETDKGNVKREGNSWFLKKDVYSES